MITKAFKQGFVDKLAELYSSARCSIKKAGFEKKADPPNKGIHDPNPLIREANRSFGFVPQAPGSYLEDANTEDKFKQVSSKLIADYADKAGIEKASPDVIGYLRSAGALNNSEYSPIFGANFDPDVFFGERPVSDYYGPGIFVGSYPFDAETILRHEYGHHLDSEKNPDAFLDASFGGSVYDREARAWNEAGVPEDDPIRVAALAGYKHRDDYMKTLDDGHQPTDDEQTAFNAERKRMFDVARQTAANNYKRLEPQNVASINSSGIPIYYNRDTDMQMPAKISIPMARLLMENAGIYDSVQSARHKPVKPNRRFYTSSRQHEKAMDSYRKRLADWSWRIP